MFWLTTSDFARKKENFDLEIFKSNFIKNVKSFSQNFFKYHGCGVYFMDGTLLLDGKHRGVHHKKCFLPVTQPFWKRPEDVINNVETRSQL